MNHQQALTTYITSFVSELVQTGVTDAVISPGSRSTPIAMVLAEHPDICVHIQVDERSAAFFALGIAKASKKPVVLLCTSGTAAANYFPAITEAKISRIPLIVLTADRPHELRDVGAPQTIDQVHLYGTHVKWFVEMALPEETNEMIRYVRTVSARAFSTAIQAPAGPVHLNFPLREPLIPMLDTPDLFQQKERNSQYVSIQQATMSLSESEFDYYAGILNSAQNGIIVCGQMDDNEFAESVVAFAEKLNFPIITDPLSQLRSGIHQQDLIIDTYDAFLRNENTRQLLKSDLIIRFGSMPVSKMLTFYLKENHQARQLVIDGAGGWRDPAMLSTDMIYCQESVFCRELVKKIDVHKNNRFTDKWKRINEQTKKLLSRINKTEFLSEGKLFYQLSELLPEDSTVFVGNSMPIRDLDSFFHTNPKRIRIMANRGANGIDGTISTALGASTVYEPLYLILGDLTFFHDINGLLAAKLSKLNVTILLINNNGGGIFSFLPQSSHPKHFEKLFGTPLDLDFSKVVEMYGGQHTSISDWNHFSASIIKDREKSGLRVIELMTNRDYNVKEHHDLWNYVSQEIQDMIQENENGLFD